MTTYWFKPRRYGFGTTSVTWQGRVVKLTAFLLVIGASLLFAAFGLTVPCGWIALVTFDAAVLAGAFVVVRGRTDGDWRWRWGND